MADTTILVPRARDSEILEFFTKLKAELGFNDYSYRMLGTDDRMGPDHPATDHIRHKAGFVLQDAQANFPNSVTLYFSRGQAPGSPSAVFDNIKVHNSNNQPRLEFSQLSKIDDLIRSTFLRAEGIQPLYGDSSALGEMVRSHQQIIGHLEENIATVGRRFAEERIKLQNEYDDLARTKKEEFEGREKALKTEYEKRMAALDEREKRLDDRANTHARRAIRADLKEKLKQHSSEFRLTEKTRRLRTPIHIAAGLFLILLSTLIIALSLQIGTSETTNWPLLARLSLAIVAALGLAAWYLRWMNRWFEKHADAEFYFKQFELDVDRASWVVETAMEWRTSQHGILPSRLLKSISKNLFVKTERDEDSDMHPADYLASALLGKASRARVVVGDSEVDFDRRAIKEVTKK